MIIGSRINLKPIDIDDIEWLRESRNRYHDAFFDAHEISKEQQRAWYDRYKESNTDRMFILQLKNGTNIGTIALYNIDIPSRTAILGRVLLLNEFRGKGYAEEAVKLIYELAFDQLRLYKIKVEVYLTNLDAISIYSRVGFKMNEKPIVLLEAVNPNYDPKKTINVTE